MKPNKRTITIHNKPTPAALKELAEAHFAALIIMSQLEGLPEASRRYHNSALVLLSNALGRIQEQFLEDTGTVLDLSHVEGSFSSPESLPDEQA